MKKLLLSLIIVLCSTSLAWADGMRGDVNGDNAVTPADISAIIDYLLGSTTTISPNAADLNRDGTVTPADISVLIDYLLNGTWPDEPEPAGEVFTVNGVSFTMIPVEGGTFMMGATSEQGTDATNDEIPVHQVTLSSYAIGQTEVTQELWEAVMGSNPSRYVGAQRPVHYIRWNDCQTFISRLNELTGRNFRLPTEAEWEFASRGGNLSQGYKYSGSNDVNEVAWYWYTLPSWSSSDPGYGPQPVATKAPNELGIYDMSGNVNEWCQDWFDDYSSSAQVNPTGPTRGDDRVRRGGGFMGSAKNVRVSARYDADPIGYSSDLGMRLAL